MELALIGIGYWGHNLLREFNNCGVLKVVCEINLDAINKFSKIYPNLRFTSNWDEILKDSTITSVAIALPAEMHYKFAKEALCADKDVFVEKPITLDIREAEDLIKLAKEHNKILMVGHILHYHPCIEKIKEIIMENRIGKIKNITSNRFNLGIFRTQENVLWSFAPHDISVILSLCKGLPTSISCQGKDILTKGIHDVTNTILEWDKENIYVNINVNWLNPFKEQKLIIIGEKGMLLFDDTLKENKLKLFDEYIKWSNTVPTIPSPIKTEGINIAYDDTETPLLRECKHFIECCIERKTPITDGEEGLNVLKILDCSTLSLMNNGKKLGFTQIQKDYFLHQTSFIDIGAEVGKGTKIWHFTHITQDAKIGQNCIISQNCYIAGIIGDACKIQNNVSIYKGLEVGNFVFIGPSAVFTNDLNPKAKYSKNGNYIKTIIEDEVTIGANSTIRCGITLRKGCFVGCGAVVLNDVEPFKIVAGNPARVIGEIDEFGNRKIYKH